MAASRWSVEQVLGAVRDLPPEAQREVLFRLPVRARAIQTERGNGDYAARRHRMLGGLSVDQLLARMRRRPAGGRRARRSRRPGSIPTA